MALLGLSGWQDAWLMVRLLCLYYRVCKILDWLLGGYDWVIVFIKYAVGG